MHLRGKAMAMEAILPDGTIQIISYVGKFDFNWMTNYIYADDDAPGAAERHDHSRHGLVRQHGRATSAIPIRISGWDGATGRWMRWRTRG